MGTKLLFIVGVPRSGTTMLRELLSQHSEIDIPSYEMQLLPRLIQSCGENADFSDDATLDRLIATLRKSNFLYHIADSVAYDLADVRQSIRGKQWHGVAEVLIRTFLPSPKPATIIGEKTPSNLMEIERFSRVFPDCRFVHIVRDPRDVCLSMRKAWGKDLYRGAVRWLDYLTYYNNVVRNSQVSERCCEIRYEDLISEPRPTMQKLCSFLQVEFEESVLSLRHGAERLGEAAGAKEIRRDNQNKFTRHLSVGQIEMIESVTWPFLAQYDYGPLYATRQSPVNRFRYGLTAGMDFLNGMRAQVRDKGLIQGVRYRIRQIFMP